MPLWRVVPVSALFRGQMFVVEQWMVLLTIKSRRLTNHILTYNGSLEPFTEGN